MARSNPVSVHEDMKRDKHEEMCDDMHSALYSLSDKVRKPHATNGDKLLPKTLQSREKPEAKSARKHIARLHRAFRGEK